MSLLDSREYYKPFAYPWAFEAYHLQQQMHWLARDIPLAEDVNDWNKKLSYEEKHLLTQLFRFFTQADLDIAGGYYDKFIPYFKQPEVRMMLGAFANMESVHQHAYSLLLDTVGMPETEYKAFSDYQEMQAKHEYMKDVNPHLYEKIHYIGMDGHESFKRELLKTLAIYSAFGEGLQLFSSFAILLNFPRNQKMKGMGQIVTYSIRDESLHVESMMKLFHAFLDENRHLWRNQLKSEIYQAAQDMVALEERFINLAFSQGGIEGLSQNDVKQYIYYIADKRLLQLGLKPKFKVKENPLDWLDWILNGDEHANFFETRATEYGHGTVTGNWEDVWRT